MLCLKLWWWWWWWCWRGRGRGRWVNYWAPVGLVPSSANSASCFPSQQRRYSCWPGRENLYLCKYLKVLPFWPDMEKRLQIAIFLQIIIVFASDNTNSICNFYAIEALLATQQSVNFVVLICGAKILHLCPTSQTQVWQVRACQAKSRGRHAICLLCFQSSFTIF